MAESYEVIAFQRCSSFLQEGLQHELDRITVSLFARGLVSTENKERCLSRTEPPLERCNHLLSVLESRIRIDPASFDVILQELDSCQALKVLATKLRSELERVTASGSHAKPSRKRESESQSVVCKPKLIKVEREPQQELPTELSIEEVSQGASASLTASGPPSPTVLTAKRKITFLEYQFSVLVMQLFSVLTMLERQSDGFVNEIRAAVILAIPMSLKYEHQAFLESCEEKFEQASKVTDILKSLCSYWNYLNVSLFEYIVTRFGGDELKAKLEEYLRHLKDFRQSTKLGDFIDAFGEDKMKIPPGFKELKMRMGTSWYERSLEDVEQLRQRLCSEKVLHEHELFFSGAIEGSVILVWGVAETVVSSLLSILDDNELRKYDISAIDCNSSATVLDTLPATLQAAKKDHAEEPEDRAQEAASHPQATPQEEKKEKGGYECEFVEPPPKQLQSECSICLLVLREPCLISCCGNSFCETCIRHIQRDGKPCPLCKEPGFTTVANGGLKRALNELQVHCLHRDRELSCDWVGKLGNLEHHMKEEVCPLKIVCCPHKNDGCGWTGELEELDKHLNKNPVDASNHFHGCPYVEISCIYCTILFQRHIIEHHELSECPQRPYSCDYCREYKASFDDVVNKHHPVCKHYPLQCPNKCGHTIERQNLEHHLKEECPRECEFSSVGCGVKLPRKDLEAHMENESMTHISLLAAENQRIAKKRDEAMQDTHKRVSILLAIFLTLFIAYHYSHLHERYAPRYQMDVRYITTLVYPFKDVLLTAPVEFKVCGFTELKDQNIPYYSTPFYTHKYGYKMDFEVVANGDDDGAGTHVSVYTHLLYGNYDSLLKWPFQDVITIQLLSHENKKNYHKATIDYSKVKDNATAGQLPYGEIALGLGHSKFISHSKLHKFLKNDCLIFKIF